MDKLDLETIEKREAYIQKVIQDVHTYQNELKNCGEYHGVWILSGDQAGALLEEIRRLQERVAEYERWEHGCKDHGCLIEKPVGMGTNGECRCPQWILRRELYRQQKRVKELEEALDPIAVGFRHLLADYDDDNEAYKHRAAWGYNFTLDDVRRLLSALSGDVAKEAQGDV